MTTNTREIIPTGQSTVSSPVCQRQIDRTLFLFKLRYRCSIPTKKSPSHLLVAFCFLHHTLTLWACAVPGGKNDEKSDDSILLFATEIDKQTDRERKREREKVNYREAEGWNCTSLLQQQHHHQKPALIVSWLIDTPASSRWVNVEPERVCGCILSSSRGSVPSLSLSLSLSRTAWVVWHDVTDAGSFFLELMN